MLIVVGGMIGLGKSSVAEILGNHFNSEVFYESVDDNPILPLFYSESEEEILKNRYPFLFSAIQVISLFVKRSGDFNPERKTSNR